MRKVSVCIIAIATTLIAVASGPFDSPVTEAELATAVRKAESVLISVLSLPSASNAAEKSVAPTAKPATRTQTIKALDRIFEMARPKFKYTPRLAKVDTSRFGPIADPTSKAKLTKLISWGCVAPVGPVAAGKKDALTPDQLGDALGYLLCRIAELTHTPSIEFSPYLSPDAAPVPSGRERSKDGHSSS